MRIRNLKNAPEILEQCSYIIKKPKDNKGNYQRLFKKHQPIFLEIGMGKGQFIITMAQQYPQFNFIGLEKYDSIIARAATKTQGLDLPNLYLIKADALDLKDIFAHEINGLYLNFSDPWPKKRHAHRRLTSENFLRIYDDIFIGQPLIMQKTDNADLFANSIISLSNYGYVFETISFDLKKSEQPNIMTEYEEKFSRRGQPIFYLKATKK